MMTSPSSDIKKQIAELAPWFHNLHLPDGTQTAPDHFLGDFPAFKWKEFSGHLPERLDGWEALDVGCNAGFYSFELARRGARVTGIDLNGHYLTQAKWAVTRYGVEDLVDFHRMQVYELAGLNRTFDLVLFLGVFYHLRYPLLGLDIVARKVNRMLIFQTLMMPGRTTYEAPPDREINDREAFLDPSWPKMAFIENRIANDPTNWWVANHSGVEAMLRSTGLKVVEQPGSEIYICAPDPENTSPVMTWDAAEYLCATGHLKSPDLD